MVNLAKSGKRVVRLKGGDPMIFGRAGEEIAACKAANIAVEVVPGITAAQGAASVLGVPLTDRKHARRLQYVTGHGSGGALPADFDWQSLADRSTTTAIYMPTRTLAALVGKAIEQGLDPATPAIAITRATRPDQIVISDQIGKLPAQLSQAAPDGPVLVMVGRVFSLVESHVRRRDEGSGELQLTMAVGAATKRTSR
jgi:uroporphyrin-III C-methyltransferase/precorrin-2 dehydrogenase/sirohydrochlorin ferrochelatase